MTLNNVSNGALEDLFQRELQKVMANIASDEVPATSVRKIILEIKFTPSQNRTEIVTAATAISKCPEANGAVMGLIYAAAVDGELIAISKNPTQLSLADQLQAANERRA
jgi:hypothetical protein